MVALVLSLATAVGVEVVPRCDMVEINHYRPQGGGGFTQAIAWDWNPQFRRYDAQAWIMVDNWTTIPGGVAISSSGRRIAVRCKFVKQSTSDIDPERENQKVFPIEERRKVW